MRITRAVAEATIIHAVDRDPAIMMGFDTFNSSLGRMLRPIKIKIGTIRRLPRRSMCCVMDSGRRKDASIDARMKPGRNNGILEIPDENFLPDFSFCDE